MGGGVSGGLDNVQSLVVFFFLMAPLTASWGCLLSQLQLGLKAWMSCYLESTGTGLDDFPGGGGGSGGGEKLEIKLNLSFSLGFRLLS